ncbi:MAG: GlcG/HbpS family heme-binding protein, partial [Planctomycetota bacterium]
MKMKIRGLVLALLTASSAGSLAAEEPAIVELRVLSHPIAHRIVLAALQDCAKRGYNVSASVVDRNGNLAAFLRNPLSGPHTVKVSQRKAFTAATSKMSTADLSSRPDLNFAPDMLLIVGGVPISFNGHFYGSVGVAGAPPEIDQECAEAGIQVVSDT